MGYLIELGPSARSNIAQALKDKHEIVVRREAARVADLAVEEGIRLARQDLYTDRPTSRRRSPGSARYVNGFSAKVEGSRFPFKVKLTNRSKVAKLIENGSPGHQIRKPEKGLWTPAEGHRSAHANAYGGVPYDMPKTVSHPGTEAHKIMERALKSAFQKRGSAVRATK